MLPWDKEKMSSDEGTAEQSSSGWASPFQAAFLFVCLEEFKKGCTVEEN